MLAVFELAWVGLGWVGCVSLDCLGLGWVSWDQGGLGRVRVGLHWVSKSGLDVAQVDKCWLR